MRQCFSCDGFLPVSATACPHCDAAVALHNAPPKAPKASTRPQRGFFARLSKRARVMAIGAGTGIGMMTLMACYGMPPEFICNKYEDKDGDGFKVCVDPNYRGGKIYEEDCNDNDKTIHPGAEDTKGDGIDQNCDGVDGVQSTDPNQK